VGGHSVAPAQVARWVRQYDGIVDATVYGEHHDLRGDVPKLRVSCMHESVKVEELRRWCVENIGSRKTPGVGDILMAPEMGPLIEHGTRS
jgi:acyl-coenzyme A synthetase/AMP-(fatty) acid ligase